MKYLLYELLWLFVIYSFLGWCLEVATAAIKRKHFVNKGFLNAPFCLLYGLSAVAFEVFLPELRDHLFFLFLGSMIVASFLEYWESEGTGQWSGAVSRSAFSGSKNSEGLPQSDSGGLTTGRDSHIINGTLLNYHFTMKKR